jgi:predicted O-methyltransferase YrrM
MLRRGIADLFLAPAEAIRYWKYVLLAAAEPPPRLPPAGPLSTRPIEAVFPGIESVSVTLQDYRFEHGTMPIQEVAALCRIARHLRPRTIFEFGTFEGETTLQLAVNADAQIHTLDLPPGRRPASGPGDPHLDVYPPTPGLRFRNSSHAGRIRQHLADSAAFDEAPFRGSVDLVFVDGCHHYEYVRSDSAKAMAMLAPGGAVVWHDYSAYAPGVVRALEEIRAARPLVHIAGTSLAVLRP